MKDELVSFETAKLAKEKGFNEPCNSFYDLYNNPDNNLIISISVKDNWNNYKSISVPTQSLLQKWLREVHNIQIEVMLYHMHGKWVGEKYKYGIYRICKNEEEWNNTNKYNMEECFHKDNENSTYEEALEAGLLEGLKLIK